MTNNQIAYWNLQETKQHNREVEAFNTKQLHESIRHNKVGETLSSLQTKEILRSNRAKENETARHNLATENLDLSKLAETRRYNTGQLNLGQMNVEETRRHNAMTEYIQQSAQLADKLYKETQNALKSRELDISEAKELQRISESLRDYNEIVRHHDLQALTSSSVQSLITSIASKLSGMKLPGVITNPSRLLPGPTAAIDVWSKLKGFGNKLMIINEKIFPELITPDGSQHNTKLY